MQSSAMLSIQGYVWAQNLAMNLTLFTFAWQGSIVDFSINLAWVACSVNHNIDAGFNNRSSPKSM